MNRRIVGAYRESRAGKVQELCGVSKLGVLMATKRIWWAAPVYHGRHLPELQEIAGPILREVIEDTELRWMRGAPEQQAKIEIEELRPEEVEEWTDGTGSRSNERAAGVTRTRGMYLGTMATMADAESVGVMLAWEGADTVALDSQGVTQRIWSLRCITPRSWTEETLKAQMQERPRKLMWVRMQQWQLKHHRPTESW